MNKFRRPRWTVIALLVGVIVGVVLFVRNQPPAQEAAPEVKPSQVTLPPDVMALPEIEGPLPEADVEGNFDACEVVLGGVSTPRVLRAVELYSSFPSSRPRDQILAEMRPLVFPEFFERTRLEWEATTEVRGTAENVRVTTCEVGDRYGFAQELLVQVDLDAVNTYAERKPVELPFSVFVARMEDGYVVSDILPAGIIDTPEAA